MRCCSRTPIALARLVYAASDGVTTHPVDSLADQSVQSARTADVEGADQPTDWRETG